LLVVEITGSDGHPGAWGRLAVRSCRQMVLQRQPYGAGSERERQFINALALIYQDAATVPYHTRALNYEHAMSHLASENSKDVEAQVFYALWEF